MKKVLIKTDGSKDLAGLAFDFLSAQAEFVAYQRGTIVGAGTIIKALCIDEKGHLDAITGAATLAIRLAEGYQAIQIRNQD